MTEDPRFAMSCLWCEWEARGGTISEVADQLGVHVRKVHPEAAA